MSLCFALGVSAGCQPAPVQSVRPAPIVGESPSALRAFRPLADAWRVASPEQRVALQVPLKEFLQQYPDDDQARLARAYLAWIHVQTGALYEARQMIEATKRGPGGAAGDFAVVAEAALLVEHNRPQEAITILRPLQGKIVDPTERFLGTETMVRAALAAELYSEALLHMIDWLAQADGASRPAVRESILSHLRHIPRRYLERALETMEPNKDEVREADRARLVQHQWLYDALSARLAVIALTHEDAQLAQRVIDHNPTVLVLNEQSAQLVRLASGGQAPAHISGRTVGLLLNLTQPQARRRSSEVAAGLMLGLDALRGTDEQGYRLVLAENDGMPENGLSELAAQGAALIVGGVTPAEAVEVARYAELARLPVLLLEPGGESPFAFNVGVSEQQQLLAMNRGIDQTWLPSRVLTERDCAPRASAETPFPFEQWREGELRSLLIFAGEICARDLFSAVRASKRTPWRYVLGLEAAHLWQRVPAGEARWLRAGRFPLEPSSDPEAARWAAQLGHPPTWYEVLGRDAAWIARAVLDALPALQSDERSAVQAHHRAIREALSRFRSDRLWSSEQARFERQTLTRSLSLSDQ